VILLYTVHIPQLTLDDLRGADGKIEYSGALINLKQKRWISKKDKEGG
jgi:hypothetical protein